MSFSVRSAAVVIVCGLLAAAGAQPALAQRGDGGQGRDVRPPKELLREYPFRQGELTSGERPPARRARAARRTSAPAASVDQPADAGGVSGLTIALALGAGLTLLLLGMVGRRVALATAGGRRPEPDPPPRKQRKERQRPPAEPAPRARRFGRRDAAPEPPAPPVPSGPGPRNRYAVANQKGGVGKTTVSLVLGAAAARRGKRVLLVDLDPQASATMVLGADTEHSPNVSDVMLDPTAHSLGDTIAPTLWGVDLAPSERALREADVGVPTPSKVVLPQQMETVGDYDLVLFDCPPNLGALTHDALMAASHVLVVTEPSFLALQSMEELVDTLRYVAAEHNPSLELAGIVLNRVETTAEHKHGVAELENGFGSRIWEPHIPRRAVLQDAMRRGVPPQDLGTHYASEIAELFDSLAQRLEASRAPSSGAP